MTEANLKYRIKYNVYCTLRNFFDKETVIKNCMSELHAKVRLKEFLQKKYGRELEDVRIFSCIEEGDDKFKLFGDLGIDFSNKTK